MIDDATICIIHATGDFAIGGSMGDCGLTGRQLLDDTYGGSVFHDGDGFSGKDPSKVNRSASYMCRHIAKNIVAAGLARSCELQVAYTIGVPEPVSVTVDLKGTGVLPESRIARIISKVFDLRPAAIIEHLDLLRPIYRNTAAYGHFGRSEPEFTWENTSMAGIIREEAEV